MQDPILEQLPQIQQDVLLKDFTTFRIGGIAKYFLIARTNEEIISALKLAKENNLPFFVIGGGSNVLIQDKYFPGLVIKIQNSEFSVSDSGNGKEIQMQAGINLSKLVQMSFEYSLTGIEWAIGLPGTIGGAIRGNAGAMEGSMSTITKEVQVFDLEKLETKTFSNSDCQFKYRDSIFKHNLNLFILSAKVFLASGDKSAIRKKSDEIFQKRRETQPYEFPSAGCIFKNPENMSAGKLIQDLGLKKMQIGGAQISDKHANFIINVKDASSEDVLALQNLVKQKVKEKFNIDLEEETQTF